MLTPYDKKRGKPSETAPAIVHLTGGVAKSIKGARSEEARKRYSGLFRVQLTVCGAPEAPDELAGADGPAGETPGLAVNALGRQTRHGRVSPFRIAMALGQQCTPRLTVPQAGMTPASLTLILGFGRDWRIMEAGAHAAPIGG